MATKIFCNLLMLLTYIQAALSTPIKVKNDLYNNEVQDNNIYNKNINLSHNSLLTKELFSKQMIDLNKLHNRIEATSTTTTMPFIVHKTGEEGSKILRNDVGIKEDGTYRFDFETSNGIKRTELGNPDGHMQGTSSYTSPEGFIIQTSFVADENGYHPVGDHLPKVPEYVLKALEYIRTHPYVERDYYTGEYKTPRTPTIPTLKYFPTTTPFNKHKIQH